MHLPELKEGRQFLALLVCLLTSILLPAYIEDHLAFVVIWKLVFTVMMLAAAYTVVEKRHLWVPIVLLLTASVATVWGQYLNEGNLWLFYLDNLTTIAFLGFVCVHFLRYILKCDRVTTNVIYASVCVYLMGAIIWAAIFANIHVFYGDAFRFTNVPEGVVLSKDELMGIFSYYSFVTLATVGYGDIVPVHKVAQSWAALEGVTGQFYIAIVVARLVALHIAHKALD
ncbi:ion channel [Simiduia sp. 21SJ11W-1]|uniref:ion channel n=1 Tax=Simiduia sp. 21SJ11W-1 TaxID=2909669 RepID=UPI0020A1FC54|nr:ion channel [Simiduia sp. 21SJ11W-1]UTA46994.1 ion channel [Simiduia sp. 21SJ11W-1]